MVRPNKYPKDVLYIVLELVNGGELFDYIAKTGAFTINETRFYFKQLIEGISYLHQLGIAHRDLKTENLLMDENFNLKIADFGFAKAISQTKSLMTTIIGTSAYYAPEIHRLEAYDGEKADIFTIGVILFFFVSYHFPFKNSSDKDDLYKYFLNNEKHNFWIVHSSNKQQGFYSDDFKDLVNGLLEADFSKRFTLE
jgi:serine/threonine protein kinase